MYVARKFCRRCRLVLMASTCFKAPGNARRSVSSTKGISWDSNVDVTKNPGIS